MKVAITGVGGFIGSSLADVFIERGDEVWGIDNFLTGRRDNINPEVNFIEGDVLDPWTCPDAELVIHCAASYDDPYKWHRDTKTNVLGTINAVIAAQDSGARLFYFQTSLPPISSYAISKIAGQEYIEMAMPTNHVTFRLANIFGPRNLSGPIPTFWKRLTEGQPCTVVDTYRDMVYIDDLVRGVLNAVHTPDVYGVVDMCSGKDRAIGELYDGVCNAMGVGVVADRITRGNDDVAKMVLSPKRAAEELDWWAQWGLQEGINEAVAWYEEYGVTETYTHLKGVK